MNHQDGLTSRCFIIFRRSPALFVAIAVLPYATLHVALLLLTWVFVRRIGGEGVDLRTQWLAMTMPNRLAFLALFLLWVTLPYAVAGRGICHIAFDHMTGGETTFRRRVYDMLGFMPSAVVLGAIASIAAFLGVAIFLIPGFIVGALFSLAIPAGVVEQAGPFAALRRGVSRATRVFGLVFILFFAYSAIVFAALILQGVFVRAVPEVISFRVPILIGCSLIPIVPLVLLFICFTLLYLDGGTKPEVL